MGFLFCQWGSKHALNSSLGCVFSLILKGHFNYFPLTLFDNCLPVSFKEGLASSCWGLDEIQPLRPFSLTPSPESLLLDLNHLACYIVRSDVNSSVLLKGLTSVRIINEFCWKPPECVGSASAYLLVSSALISNCESYILVFGAFTALLYSTLLNYSESTQRHGGTRESTWHIIWKLPTP